MRRVLVLLVVAVAGALWYGVAGPTSAIAVDGISLSQGAFRAELNAFATHPGLYCYISSLARTAIFAPGAGRDTVAVSGETAWANLRVEGIAIDRYVARQLHYRPTAADLTSATHALEGELAQSAAQSHNTCAGTPAQALAQMPAEMRAAQVEDQASSMYLVSKLNSAIALTPASLQSYYNAHRARYNKICVAVAIVPANRLREFAASQAQGLGVAALAKKYSLDSSAARGGAYGCFAPTSPSYAGVRSDIGSAAVGHFPTTPIPYTPTQGGATYGLFVAATSKSASNFAQAEAAVLSDVQAADSSSANTVKASILYAAAVAIDPAYGRWGLGARGPSIFVPNLPGEAGPATVGQMTAVATSPYQ